MGYEATMYLLERGVRLTGTDAWSWDAPFVHTAKKYGETQDAVADLGRPQGRAATSATATSRSCTTWRRCRPTASTISCFPHKIRGASAGWTRAVAIFDERLSEPARQTTASV